jgi:hypothetical protein
MQYEADRLGHALLLRAVFGTGQQLMVLRHFQEEVENSNHRFDMTKSWRLFKGFQVLIGWNGMPPKWHRIFSKGSDHPAYPPHSSRELAS